MYKGAETTIVVRNRKGDLFENRQLYRSREKVFLNKIKDLNIKVKKKAEQTKFSINGERPTET